MVDDFTKTRTFFESLLKENIDLNDTEEKNGIFILGMPRSSTSLVEQIISSHSKVFGCGELTFIEKESLNLFEQKIDIRQILSFKKNYFSMIQHLAGNFSYFIDKAPLNFFFYRNNFNFFSKIKNYIM